jgi:vacuolar-type H+-ATPase subunit D/Vma8
MKIDPATVLVVVLTLIAGVFLVWIELRSRRNSQLQQAETPPQIDNAIEAAKPLVQTEVAVHKKRRRRR